MPDHCPHQFVWPRRATNGRYSQACRLCGKEYEYDWENMRRMRGSDMASVDGAHTSVATVDTTTVDTATMDEGSTDPASANTAGPCPDQANIGSKKTSVPQLTVRSFSVQFQGAPRLQLLLEPEPAHRVFLQNLTDLVLFRSPSPIATTSSPAPFWSDVFVHSGMPWWWFVESLLGHMIAVTAILIICQWWPAAEPIQRSIFDEHYVSYYTPPKSYPALGSHSPRVRAQSNRPVVTPRPPTIRVASERPPKQGQGQETIRPPSITQAGAAKLKIPVDNPPAPVMPLSATGRSRLTVPAGPTWVVAPAPESSQVTGRRSGLLQASAVAPAPEIAGVASRHPIATTAPNATIVGPAPSLPGSIRRIGSINIGESVVVKPAPQLPMDEQGAISGMAKAGLGSAGGVVVPPPPSVQSSGTLAGGWAGGLPTAGLQVVPPAPSVEGAGDSSGSGRANSLSSAGARVVPPAPSVQGADSGAGRGGANSMSAGLQAVPPAPSMQGAGPAGSGRGNSLAGAGAQAVPPSPSAPEGNSASEGGAGETGRGPAVASGQSTPTDDPHEPATVEIPLRLIGPVLALPGSSYFSNYEVFIAERKLGNHTQLIKLVYVSLPYQRRLSEYGQSDWTLRKLRVTRDQTCDESLLQMTWPETDPRPDPEHAADSPALSSKDRKGMLPCYRTTADDYRRAVSRSH